MNSCKTRVRWLFVLSFTICSTIAVHAQLGRFDGSWVNVDEDSRSITKIQIETVKDAVRVRVFGKCHPMDCDWGWIDAFAYTPDGVGADIASTASAIVATYQRGFSTTRVIIKFASPTELGVDVYTKFTDGSDRANMTHSDTMKRGS